jgi:hypothetical protein
MLMITKQKVYLTNKSIDSSSENDYLPKLYSTFIPNDETLDVQMSF